MKKTKSSSTQILFVIAVLVVLGTLVALYHNGQRNAETSEKRAPTLADYRANNTTQPFGCQYDNPPCSSGYKCVSNSCLAEPVCGNGKCEDGETSQNCCSDCGCPLTQSCNAGTQNCDTTTCSDGTAVLACSAYYKGKMCNADGTLVDVPQLCGCPDGEVLSGSNCVAYQAPQNSGTTTFTTYQNGEPYYSAFCDKIDPYDLNVREAAAEAIRNDAGAYNVVQLFDIYDWVKSNIVYQSVALAGIPYSPDQTLATKSGDCKNQAVLIASMVKSIGGTAKVIADPTCEHAYAIVYYGPSEIDMTSFSQAVTNHYGADVSIGYFTLDNGIWIIFDPAGGRYPGDTLPECGGSESRYLISSCMDCANQYPNSPYTFGNKCYSQCPPGTITTPSNQHTCSACPQGTYSYNNQCVSCPDGYVLGSNGRCYP